MAANQKAIILRGPPGGGKSAIRKMLQGHLGKSGRYINLDAYWGRGEWRYEQPAFRYADIQHATEPVLVVELAWGEPDGLAFPGATRGADEWMGLLQNGNREIFAFFVIAEWGDVLKRLTERHGGEGHRDVLADLGRLSFYEHKHYLFSYPEIPGVMERTIDTTGKLIDDVVENIINMADI
ncbi:MAG TPA: hypothetical protein VH092_16550 [Urbifossiella sp.]|nr:hypothetical protein [Urbifossiella sp.]